MRTSEAVEDYLKAIYHLGTQGGGVTTSSIAKRLGISPPSVSAMVKRLEASELVTRPQGRSVTLTPRGEVQALAVVRRHRLLETFLAQVVGVPWDEVHDEAEVLEHALSARLEARIDTLLGHPSHDPHGDPIPPPSGPHVERWGQPLLEVPPGSRFRVERVSDRDAGALRYLADLDIVPGVVVEVGERSPFGGPLWVTAPAGRQALGAPLAALVHGTVVAP